MPLWLLQTICHAEANTDMCHLLLTLFSPLYMSASTPPHQSSPTPFNMASNASPSQTKVSLDEALQGGQHNE